MGTGGGLPATPQHKRSALADRLGPPTALPLRARSGPAPRSIPTDPEHPARRWLAARHLWRPDLQLPPSVRWLEASVGPSVGGLLAAFCPARSRPAVRRASPSVPPSAGTCQPPESLPARPTSGRPARKRPAERHSPGTARRQVLILSLSGQRGSAVSSRPAHDGGSIPASSPAPHRAPGVGYEFQRVGTREGLAESRPI